MAKYSLDNICMGDATADEMNSRIMELADDIAEQLALKDWGETRDGFWVEDEDGATLSEEAHGIWEAYYDQYVDLLYKFVNTCTELHDLGLRRQLKGIVSDVNKNMIPAWEFDLEATTDAVAIQDHSVTETETIEYNGWLEKLTDLAN